MTKLTIKEILLVAALVIVSIFGVLQYTGKMKMMDQYSAALAVNDSTRNIMKLIVDENGKLHSRVESFEVDRKTFEVTHKAYVDSLTKVLNIKPKDLKSIIVVTTDNHGSFVTGLDTNSRVNVSINGKDTVKDTVRYFTFDYDKDKWLKFKGKIDSGNIFVEYKFTDSLTIVTFQKKTGFLGLGKMKTFADVKSENPNTTYNSLKHIELTNIKNKHWGFGPYVGYGYNGNIWSPNVGVSLQYILLKF
jgi:hypothetical protein